MAKIANFLFFLQSVICILVSSVKGLSSVFRFRLPEPRDNFIIRDFIWVFLASRPLRVVTIKVLFLFVFSDH